VPATRPLGTRRWTAAASRRLALLLSGALAGAGILVAVVSPDTAFLVLLGAASSVLVPLYLVLAVAQLRLRRHWEAHDPSRLTVRMWWFPYGTYLLIATTLAIAAALVLLPEFLPQAALTRRRAGPRGRSRRAAATRRAVAGSAEPGQPQRAGGLS
jgi:L-asparagine transporter-like permease